jgi:L-lactate dehydrogenase complex protein LldE
MSEAIPTSPHVGLFVTCLVDLTRPSVGFATLKLLELAGCRVSVPEMQTCCGQPAYNSGDRSDTRDIAKQVIETFEEFDYIVAPSGSCGGMISHHYLDLFKDDDTWKERAKNLANKTFELIVFLSDVINTNKINGLCKTTATYHDSCSGLRELSIKDQPREFLKNINGLKLVEGKKSEVCCGFGGLFCVKYPDISEKMLDEKVDDILQTEAEMVLGGDLGCLMNIAGRLTRRGSEKEVRHIAEVLADMTHGPGIAAPEKTEA